MFKGIRNRFVNGSPNGPKYIYGAKNINWIGPERAAEADDAQKKDFFNIAQDFTSVTNAAAVAYSSGDMDNYYQLLNHAAKVYSAHRNWSIFAENREDQEEKFNYWRSEYQRFRNAAGISENHEGIPVTQKYHDILFNDSDYDAAVEGVKDAIHQFQAMQHYQNAYYSRVKNEQAYEQNVPGGRKELNSGDSDVHHAPPTGDPDEVIEGEVIDAEFVDDEPQTEQFPPQGAGRKQEPQTEQFPPQARQKQQSEQTSKNQYREQQGTKTSRNQYREQPADNRYDPYQDPNADQEHDLGKNYQQHRNGRQTLLQMGAYAALSAVGLAGKGSMRLTGKKRVGPLVFNMGMGGFMGLSSISLKAGPVSYCLWSMNQQSGLSSVDAPGPFSYRPYRKKKQPGDSSPFFGMPGLLSFFGKPPRYQQGSQQGNQYNPYRH